MSDGTVHLKPLCNSEIQPGIFLIEEPVAIAGTNKLRCLANVHGTLAVVELTMKFENQP